jgi:arylsulfatase A
MLAESRALNFFRGVVLLLKEIDKLGVADNTYVIYMSDNGGGGGGGGGRGKGGTQPIQGGKGSLWEGGIRVPLIIRGPGIEPNTFCHVPVVGYDLFPTFCELAGVTEPQPDDIEEGSIAALLICPEMSLETGPNEGKRLPRIPLSAKDNPP